MPQQLSLQTPNMYRDATGQGSLWISPDGLPMRLSLKILYPREASGAQVEAELKTDFSNYAPVAASANPIDQLARSLGLARTAIDWRQVSSASAALLMVVGTVYVLTVKGRSKKLQVALVIAIIFSMVVTPLESQKVYAFAQDQQAQQATADQQQKDQNAAREAQAQLAGPTWNPHHDPLDNPAPTPQPPAGPVSSIGLEKNASFTPAKTADILTNDVLCTDTEKSTDTDNDGLTDCQEKQIGTDPTKKDTDRDGLTDGVEVLRLGTDPLNIDSDGDNITDYLEVTGFAAAGGHAPWYSTADQRWYSDPTNPDTDKDNLPDGLECPERAIAFDPQTHQPTVANACLDTNGDGVPENCSQLTAMCRDTNADATPDMFARDSDGDGVPDKLDLAPTQVLGTSASFSRANPFQLKVNNLSPITGTTNSYYPVLVDFQVVSL